MQPIADKDYQMDSSLKQFYEVKTLDIPDVVGAMPGNRSRIPVKAQYLDGHSEDVSMRATFSSNDIPFNGTIMLPTAEGTGTVEASYTDFCRHETRKTVGVEVKYFPFDEQNISKFNISRILLIETEVSSFRSVGYLKFVGSSEGKHCSAVCTVI